MIFLRAHTRRLAKITVPGPFTMTQLAQNEHYPDEESLAMAYADAVNEEIRDLFNAGADFVQIDEPYMQAQPEKARRYAVKAINRALEGIVGTTIVHMCFGYAAMVKTDKPNRYAFLDELRDCACQQVSVETAQPRLDCSTLAALDNKKILLGVIDLSDMQVESPQTVAGRIRRALPYVEGREHHRRPGLRHEISAARGGVRQDAGDGRRREDRSCGACLRVPIGKWRQWGIFRAADAAFPGGRQAVACHQP